MSRYRFTMNVQALDFDDESFERLAGDLLDALYQQRTNGVFEDISVSGRVDDRTMRLAVEFQSDAFNRAHHEGYRLIEETVVMAGAELDADGPLRSVTDDHSGDDFDVKVEDLDHSSGSPARRDLQVSDASTELLTV